MSYVIAADWNKNNAPTSIIYSDLLALQDQLHHRTSNKLDLILETPGGSGEVASENLRLCKKITLPKKQPLPQ